MHLGKIFEDSSEVFKRVCPIETPLLTISVLTGRLVIDVSRGKAVFHRLDLLSKKTRATSDTSLAPIIVIAEIRKRQGHDSKATYVPLDDRILGEFYQPFEAFLERIDTDCFKERRSGKLARSLT